LRSTVSGWTDEELERIGNADELELTARGHTVTIWVVCVGDHLYVRSWRGPCGSWFTAAQATHVGRISAGGVERAVEFAEVGDGVNDAVDDAYRTKYGRYPSYVEPMVQPEARATTLELVPRAEDGA
jgi:hypothetical protein